MQQKSTAALKMKSGTESLPATASRNSEKVNMTAPLSQNKQNTESYKLSRTSQMKVPAKNKGL